jgi:hypothetical protein
MMATSSNHHKFAQILESINEFIQHLKQDDSLKLNMKMQMKSIFIFRKLLNITKYLQKKD